MTMVKTNNNKTIVIVMLFGLITSILEYGFDVFSSNKDLTLFYTIQLLLLFVYSFIVSTKQLGFLHLFSLLHLTTFLFSFSGILVTYVSDMYDFRDYTSPWATLVYKEDVIQKVILIYTAYVTSTTAFFWAFYKKFQGKSQIIDITIGCDKMYLEIGKKAMIFLLPFALAYFYLQFKLTLQNRTLLYQLGSMSELGIPIYVRLGNKFFHVAYYIFVASLPSYKTFTRYSLLYGISLIPLLLSGERGDVAAIILFFLWYRNRVYGKKTNFGKLALLAVVFVIGFQILAYTRVGDEVESFSFIFLALTFLFSQSQSFNILALFISFNGADLTHNYPYFLDSLIGGLTGATGQSLETLEVRSSLGHQLMYSLNPDYYLQGASLGTSFIAEMFEFGILGVAIGGLLLSLFLLFVENNIFKTHFRLIFLLDFFSIIVLSPRGSLLPSLYMMSITTIAFIAYLSIYGLFRKKQSNL